MLSKLPVEVIVRISFYLETYEKIAVMQTCKHMSRVLGEYCLFSKVDLLDDNQTRNFLHFLEENESKKNQIRMLMLGRETSSLLPMNRIPDMFPKLEELVWPYGYYRWSTKVESVDLGSFQKISETLRKIKSGSAGYLVHDILKASTFPKLTNITISMEDGFNRSYDREIGEDFIEALKNAPNLKTLAFNEVKFSAKIVEKLHEYTPNLQKVTFTECSFLSKPEEVNEKEGKFKLTIKPNTTLTELNIIGNCDIEGKGMWWLDYISKKYNVLESLKMECHIESCGRDTTSPAGIAICEKALLTLLSGCPPTVKSFYVNKYPMTERVFEAIDKRGLHLTDTHIESSGDAKHHGLDAFFNSDQVNSVEMLTIDNLHVNMEVSLKSIKKLKHLRISYCGDKPSHKYVYIDTILKNSPASLEKLELNCARASVTTDIHRTGVYKIKLLRVYGNVDKTVYPFLNKHCKQINDLGFDLSSYRRPPHQPDNIPVVAIHLPKLDLRLFTFHIRDSALYCVVKTETQTRWYRLNPKAASRGLRVRRWDDKKTAGLDKKKHIVVECKSVACLYINGLHIY